jgi:adenosylcobinamide-GDP ribazoletransferase
VVRLNLLAAIQFLTRIPLRLRRAPDLAKIPPWFPTAGAVIGAMVGGVGVAVWHVTTPLVAGAVAVTVGLLITGAFHEDGLGDIADAFGGGHTVERRLEIMKDSRHGTYGVAAMAASIVIRVAALGSMPGPVALFTSAVAAHVLARTAAVVLMASAPLARHRGLGADYGQTTSWRVALVALISGVALSATMVQWWVAPLLVAALVGVACTGVLARRKIGGISGDVLGAAEQVAECLVLVTAVGLAVRHPVW